MAFLIYVLFEFMDTIFSSFLTYIYLPSKSYGLFSASYYGYLITLFNALGFVLLWLSLYRFSALNYSFYLLVLFILSLSISLISLPSVVLFLLFLFLVFHTAFFFWYEVLATKFEKFEIIVGLSYAAGFLALGMLLFLEKLSLSLLALLYSAFLISMLFFRNIKIPARKLDFSQIKSPRFIAEILSVWLMGEYAEVLSSMAYYVLKDSASLSEPYIHRLFATALISAFFSALLSPILLEKLGIKYLGVLTVLLMLSIPPFVGFSRLFYLLSVLVGISIALYWIFFRTYLYYRYPKDEYIYRFMFFYFSSHLGGVFLYSLIFQILQNHQLSLFIFSLLLIPALFINLLLL